MMNKILGAATLVIAVIGIILGVLLIPQMGEYGWHILLGSIFLILVGIVVFRKGISGVVSSIHDGTPKGLR